MNVRGFAALAKIYRYRMDEHRRKALEIEAVRNQHLDKDAALEAELLHEKSALDTDHMVMTDFAAYLKGIELRREELAAAIIKTNRALARVNEQMAIEFREAKKFEFAMERDAKRRKKHADKLEQAELDEIGLNYLNRAVIYSL